MSAAPRFALRLTNPRRGGWLRVVAGTVFLLVVAAGLGGVGVAVAAYVHFSEDLPEPPSVSGYRPPTISRFYADDGRLLGEFTVERREVVSLEQLPAHLVQAFLAAEDKRFFEHRGVDVRATVRAVVANYFAGSTVQGASTLTQQLCKTLVGNERSYRRKAREAILARRTEAVLDKLDILYLYLNQIYLGNGAYGVQAAARSYFHVDVWDLDLAQAAMLAGLPPQPGRVTPILDPTAAKARQRYVLDRMVEEGFVGAAEADAAWNEPLTVHREQPDIFHEAAPYFTEHVRKYVQGAYGYDALNTEGLRVYTAVDVDLQREGQDALRAGLEALGERQGYVGPLKRLDEDGLAGFLARADGHYGGPTAIEAGRTYLGAVTAVEKDGATARVGRLEVRIPLREGMAWATPYAVGDERNERRQRDARKALARGDVVMVRLLGEAPAPIAGEAAPPPVVALSQEPPVQGALVAMDPLTGYVKAMVGGYDFDQSEYNRAFQGCRQPGSIFKPVVYSLALDRDYTLATPLDDTPIVVYDQGAEFLWKPRNFGGAYKGVVLLFDALTHSMNIPAVRVIRHVGPKAAAEWATRLGITTPMDPHESLVLGSSCVPPWDMLQVYGLFALRGQRPRPVLIKRIEDREVRVLEDRTHFLAPWASTPARLDAMLRALFEPREQALDPGTAFLVQTALRGVVEGGTAVKAKKLGKPAGGKTGTTDAYDAWFAGFTESMVTVVWVGSDLNRRRLGKGETGGKAALPVWLRFMQAALADRPQADFADEPPAGIEYFAVDRATGLLAPSGNPSLNLPFKRGTEPTEMAPRIGSFDHRDLDAVEGRF